MSREDVVLLIGSFLMASNDRPSLMDYSQAPFAASVATAASSPLGTTNPPAATGSSDWQSYDSLTMQAGPSGTTAGTSRGGDASDWAELPPMLSLECPICLESPRDTVLVPCGHLLCR